MKFTNRKGKIRLYDGTTGGYGPYYLELKFDLGDFSGPIGVSETEEILVLDRGVMTSDAHYIEGGDDKVMEPNELSFSALLEDTSITENLLDWIEGNTVNDKTIVDTKGTSIRKNVTNPTFADSGKRCSNLEYKLDGAADLVWKYLEVHFPIAEQSISESDDGVTIALKGKCYGLISRDTAWTAGQSV